MKTTKFPNHSISFENLESGFGYFILNCGNRVGRLHHSGYVTDNRGNICGNTPVLGLAKLLSLSESEAQRLRYPENIH